MSRATILKIVVIFALVVVVATGYSMYKGKTPADLSKATS